MPRRIATRNSHASGGRAPSAECSSHRRKASCTTSSASAALPVRRYASPHRRRRCGRDSLPTSGVPLTDGGGRRGAALPEPECRRPVARGTMARLAIAGRWAMQELPTMRARTGKSRLLRIELRVEPGMEGSILSMLVRRPSEVMRRSLIRPEHLSGRRAGLRGGSRDDDSRVEAAEERLPDRSRGRRRDRRGIEPGPLHGRRYVRPRPDLRGPVVPLPAARLRQPEQRPGLRGPRHREGARRREAPGKEEDASPAARRYDGDRVRPLRRRRRAIGCRKREEAQEEAQGRSWLCVRRRTGSIATGSCFPACRGPVRARQARRRHRRTRSRPITLCGSR